MSILAMGQHLNGVYIGEFDYNAGWRSIPGSHVTINGITGLLVRHNGEIGFRPLRRGNFANYAVFALLETNDDA